MWYVLKEVMVNYLQHACSPVCSRVGYYLLSQPIFYRNLLSSVVLALSANELVD